MITSLIHFFLNNFFLSLIYDKPQHSLDVLIETRQKTMTKPSTWSEPSVDSFQLRATIPSRRSHIVKSASLGLVNLVSLISLLGLGNYPQDPSSYGPTRPSHTYGQDEQGYSAGRCEHCLSQTLNNKKSTVADVQSIASLKAAVSTLICSL